MKIKADKSFFRFTIILMGFFFIFSISLDYLAIELILIEKNIFLNSKYIIFCIIVCFNNVISIISFYLSIKYYKKTNIFVNNEIIEVTCLKPHNCNNIIEAMIAPYKLPTTNMYTINKKTYYLEHFIIYYKQIQQYGYAKDLNVKGKNIEKNDIVILTKENKKEKQYIISSNQFKKDDLYLIIKELEKRTKLLFNCDLSQFEVD